MTMANLQALQVKFLNWSFTLNPSVGIELIAERTKNNNIDEMLKLIEELNHFFKNQNVILEIENLKTLQIRVKKGTRPSKYRKMYTSGCFDIFHYGHLNILKKSKELCDYLIVGVSTDELILKEKGRLPVIPFDERINVVKAIKYVDEVIPQIDKNKQRVVDEYAIDAISVGDDWRGRFPETSCPVEYFSYTKNVSSTILKQTLKLDNK